MGESMLSVGIDIGTATTHLVFSRLFMENLSPLPGSPDFRLTGKEVIYRGSVRRTPLLDRERIDGRAVRELVAGEYRMARIEPGDVATGAVIITGETARKENAREVLDSLSDFAGDFVVAAAGPSLEGILAGRGAGTEELSRRRGITAANLDIGGGTTNIALFKNGEAAETCCLDIGGRLIEYGRRGEVVYLSPKLAPLIRALKGAIRIGEIPPAGAVPALAALMAELVGRALAGASAGERDALLEAVITDHPLRGGEGIRAITFSGGVSDAIYPLLEGRTPGGGDYGDMGADLGRAIAKAAWLSRYEVAGARETIRATVVGAGCHTTELSGSTIKIDQDLLPLRNLPVLTLDEGDQDLDPEELAERIGGMVRRAAAWDEAQPFVVGIPGKSRISYGELERLGAGLARGLKILSDRSLPLILTVEQDIAKALGGVLKRLLPEGQGVICIDGVGVKNGDFLDIGKAVAGGTVVPVVVKTLAFG